MKGIYRVGVDVAPKLGTKDAQLEANLRPQEFQSRFGICIV